MKVVTMVKNGWLAQSNSAQLNWPSFETSRFIAILPAKTREWPRHDGDRE